MIKIERATIFALACCFIVALSGCEASPTARASSLKLSSEELGTKEAIGVYLNTVARDVRSIDISITKAVQARDQRNFGIADHHYGQANALIYKWRDSIFVPVDAAKPRIVYPQSMIDIGSAWKELYLLRQHIPQQGELSDEQLNAVLGRLRKIVEADAAFAATVASRKSNPDLIEPKASLTMELTPFPFKLEILNGEFKVKKSFSFGGLRGDVGVGTSGSRSGITTLILVHNGNARYYAVGNRQLTFEVPSCRIDISGSVMTITTLDRPVDFSWPIS